MPLPALNGQGRAAAGIFHARPRGPLPPVVYRDACNRCGARGDYGCGHSTGEIVSARFTVAA